MRRGLLLVFFILFSLWFFPPETIYSQGREVLSADAKLDLPVILKGARNPETLPDLASAYCSNGASDDIYVDPSLVPTGNTHIVWNAITNVGGIPVVHPGWIEPIGVDPDNGVRFFPDRVSSEYQGSAIFIQYQFDNGTTGYDYTYIRKSPVSFTLSGGTDLCLGATGTLVLDGSESNYEYFLYVDGVLSSSFPISGNGQPLNFSVSDPGIYTVEARRSDQPYCSGLMDGAPEIVVNVLPEPSASSNTAVCSGETIELYGDADGAAIYSWSGPDGFASTDLNPMIPDATSAMGGIYIFTVIDSNGCQNSSSTTVTVHEIPQVTVSNSGPVCENQAVTIASVVTGGTAPFSYVWEKDGSSLPLISTPEVDLSAASMADAGSYEVFVTDANGCAAPSVSATTTLIVNELPVVSISEDLALCEGNSATFSATVAGGDGNYVYSWSFNGTPISGESQASLTIQNATVAQSGNYMVTVTDGNSCSASSASATLSVNENPTVTIAGSPLIEGCLGSDNTLDASATGGSPGYVFNWELPDGSMVNSEDLTLNNIANSQAGIYKVMVTDGASCGDTAQVEVLVNHAEAAISISSPTGATICEGTAVTFNATGGVNYTFFLNGSQVANNTTGIYTTSSLTNGNQVFVHVVDEKGCEDDSEVIIMTVNPNPVVVLSVTSPHGNQPCEGQSVEFTATSGFVNYVFYVNGAAVQNGSEPIMVSESLTSGDQVTVMAQSVQGCTGTSPAQTVTFNPLPTATLISDQSDNKACPGQPVTFTAGGGATYEFMVDGVSQGVASGNSVFTMNALMSGTSNVSVMVTDLNGCSSSAFIDLTLNEAPVVALGEDQTVCEGSSVTLAASVSGGSEPYSYAWELNGSSLTGLTTSSLLFPDIAASDAGLYTVTVTDNNACPGLSVSESVNIQVNSRPSVTLTSNSPICENSQMLLSAAAYGGSGGGSFVWYKNGVELTGQTTNEYEVSNAQLSDADTYEVVAIDDNGCQSQPAATVVEVNELPDATLTADQLNIFRGTEVTFTAGGGNEYVFFWNGTEVQSRSTGNVYTNSLLDNGDEVSVQVFDSNDCSQTASLNIGVFDVVAVPVLSLENGTYCQGEAGARLTVDNPLVGVIYEIVFADNSSAGYPLIEYDGLNTVEWEGVTDQNKPTTFKVAAYRSALPGEIAYSQELQVVEGQTPDVYTMSVDGSVVTGELTVSGCPGGVSYNIGLSPSWGPETYQLLLNGTQVLEEKVGGPVPIVFAGYNSVGTYTIRAISSEGCSVMMTGSFTIEGDGSETGFDLTMVPADGTFCEGSAGVEISLEGSLAGSEYILFNNGLPLDTLTGSGNSLSFGLFNQAGTYHSEVITPNGCVFPMNNSLTLVSQPAPDPQVLSATNSGHYCQGSTGVRISLDDQVTGVRYELIDYDTKVVVDSEEGLTGDGTLFFKTAGGDDYFVGVASYQVRAINISSGCEAFGNEISLVEDAVPNDFSFSGDTDYCAGGGAALLSVNPSQSQVTYELYLDGSTTGMTLPGDGSELNFGVSQPGAYTVMATHSVGGCSLVSTESVSVTEKPLPDAGLNVTAVVTGDPADCSEVATLSIEASENNVTYDLVKILMDASLIYTGNSVIGDGNTIQFPNTVQDKNATYGVMAALNGCQVMMTNTVSVDMVNVPQLFVVTGDGEKCEGESAQAGLSGSETDVDYELYLAGNPVALETLPGSGSALTFVTSLSLEGSYYVMGVSTLTGCSLRMSGELEVKFNALPGSVMMTGSGVRCEGSEAILGLESSEPGIEYNLLWENGGTDEVKDTQSGAADGGAIAFAPQSTNGVYKVWASNATTGCSSFMTNTVEVVEKATPAKPLIADADTVYYCVGEGGYNLAVTNVIEGVTYQLFDQTNTLIVGNEATTEPTLELGTLIAGAYVVRASWGGDACFSENSDSLWVLEAADPLVTTPFTDGENIARSGNTVDYTFAAENLQEGVTYWLINETVPADTIEFTFEGLAPVVTISETGTYKLLGFFSQHACEPVTMNGRLEVLNKSLLAVEDYLYLSDGENMDSLYTGINDELAYVDEGNVEFALVDVDGTEYSTYETTQGIFTMRSDGLFIFEKAPSFYGTLELTYKIWNKDQKDSRYSVGSIFIFAGNKDIAEDQSIMIPNAFSPNDDGHNDLFEVSVGNSIVEASGLEVFNRWGTLVYRSKGETYDNLWDGISNVSSMISIGNKLPGGVYFYIFTIKVDVEGDLVSKKFNGFIELRR